jgi:polyisoprenoid-binding protein YceI
VKKALFLLSGVLSCAATGETAYELVPAKTAIKFSLPASLHTVHGTFQLKRGSVHFDSETARASGEIVIDLASAATGNESRDRNMHRDVLESERYPEAVFIPDRIDGKLAPQDESQVDVHGMLRIHGSDHELMLHIQVLAKDGQYVVSTHFAIPYVEWGMKNPSTFLLRVDKKVEVDVRATATAAAAR